MEKVFEQLKQQGYRLTQPRQQILDTLTSYPQSVAEIVTSLKKKQTNVDMATVYRTLEILVELGVVGKIQFHGKTAMFELLSEDDHHHHLICNDCGLIEDIPFDEVLLMNQVNKQTKFQVQSHSLEFFGLCTNCQ
jgi:Fur family ferric uptake transcriptional regulator